MTANGMTSKQNGDTTFEFIAVAFIETKSNEIYGAFDESAGGISYSHRPADATEFTDVDDIPKLYKDARARTVAQQALQGRIQIFQFLISTRLVRFKK